jgi:hypothetical protein
MIVRCTSCNSAFAVDDAKVNDKKFAFTCPKCENENVIDNRKQSQPPFAGPAIVDEAYEEIKPAEPKETVLGTDKEDYFREIRQTKGSDVSVEGDKESADKPLFDDLTLSDTDDLSGLAEPEQLEETGTAIETTELPPADDMSSEIPLDDMTLDDELEDLDISNKKGGAEKKSIGIKPEAADEISGKTTFEELGEELDDFKSDSGLIHDEMETQDDAGEPIELEEIDDIDKLLEEDGKEREIIDDFEPLEDETMKTASKSSDLDMALNEEIKAEEMYRAEDKKDDESITIDLDTLDIDLEYNQEDIVKKPSIASRAIRSDMTKSPAAAAVVADEDENITIDLDSLDIELQDEKEVLKGESHEELGLDLSDFSEETIEELEGVSKKPKLKDDEDITLDLSSLDITLEENDEIKEGEALDENEKLTLEDAGLTLEELTADELTSVSKGTGKEGAEDDDIRLTIDEIDPNLDMHAIEKELEEAESILSESPEMKDDLLVVDELSDLPELDLDEELNLIESGAGAAAVSASKRDDELIRIDDSERVSMKKGGLQKVIPDMATHGAVNFSIDYSIKYSRIGAVLRILGLFFLGLVPHYLVFIIYAILSIILGFINHIVVIATEKNIEDFSEIHENTLRYLLSISASAIGIVEEMPIFAGRYNLDYPLQMRINYPLRSSRLLAFLRLSCIGILLFTIPQFLILGLLSLVIPIVFIGGTFSVFITGGWPHILFEFMTRYYRYLARVMAFSIGIVDVYPKFKFD